MIKLNQSDTEYPIMPLEIPANWFVSYNNFFLDQDIEGIEDGYIVNNLGFSQDLIVIEQLSEKDDKIIVDRNNFYIIDLGWYPESKADGNYGLTFMYNDWENVKFEYDSTDRYIIQRAIAFCLNYVNINGKVSNDFDKIAKTYIRTLGNLPSKKPKLLPLKIHGQWAILRNHFYDLSFKEMHLLISDQSDIVLLKLMKARPTTDNDFSWKFNSFEIRLIWKKKLSEGDRYLLKVLDSDDVVLFEYEHKNRFIIQSVINFCLETLSFRSNDIRDRFDEKVNYYIKRNMK